MRIWVFASGEPLPSATSHVRLLRAGNLSNYLQAAGHEVVWWASSYDHFNKRQVPAQDLVQPAGGYQLRALRSPGYKANFGVARLFDHAVLGWRFWRGAIAAKERPDVIWCSFPPIETALAAVHVGLRLRVPVVLDVRDLWPDVFLDALPKAMRRVGRICLAPYFMASVGALKRATGLVGVTDSYLQWGLARAGRAKGRFDRCFPMGYPDFDIPAASMLEAQAFWRNKGVAGDSFNICFFGTIGRQFDIATVINAAAQLQTQSSNARFILCGQGSALDGFREQADGLANVLFPGHVNAPEIKALMDLSAIGLAPYHDTENFQLNIPNKIFEYAAGALPVLSGIDGEVGRFLRARDIGHIYPAQDARLLATLVLRLEGERDKLRRQGERARALFCAQFDARIISADIEGYLREIVEDDRSRS